MTKFRDISEAQFLAAIQRRGWSTYGFLGYVKLGNGVQISRFNGGATRREQLAYLIRQADKIEATPTKGA